MARAIVALAGVAVAAAATVAVAVALDHHAPDQATTPASRAEDTFVAVTAAHLCNVGRTVYADPKALADAYQSAPPYPGLTAQQVADLTKRLHSDENLTQRLTRALQETCHPQ
jgi:hypothetical protein